MMKRIKEFKNHSQWIGRLLLANIVVVSLMFISSKRVENNHRSIIHYRQDQRSLENALTLNEAIASFNHYMHNLVKQYHLPHTTAQQEHDLINTELTFIDVATGPQANDVVPLPDVIELKATYKDYLQSLYPKHFATTSAEKTVPRKLAKKRIQAAVIATLVTKNKDNARLLWKQIKHSFVSHQLDGVTFLDDAGMPVVTEQDFNRVLHDTDAYVNKHFKTKKNSKPHGLVATLKNILIKKQS